MVQLADSWLAAYSEMTNCIANNKEKGDSQKFQGSAGNFKSNFCRASRRRAPALKLGAGA